uniref:Immunoglobulin V-set domain-containing protein n=1 Tax=Nothoprocta perdicaria TaxID=30464 RepID=A0A8C7ECK0_NOTPE
MALLLLLAALLPGEAAGTVSPVPSRDGGARGGDGGSSRLAVPMLPGASALLAALVPFLTGEVGGSLTHQCFYPGTPANKYERKYWCKEARGGPCRTVVSSSGYVARGYEGRAALRDAPHTGAFTVWLAALRSSDAGAYRCGIGPAGAGLFVRQHLSVWAGGSGRAAPCGGRR